MRLLLVQYRGNILRCMHTCPKEIHNFCWGVCVRHKNMLINKSIAIQRMWGKDVIPKKLTQQCRSEKRPLLKQP